MTTQQTTTNNWYTYQTITYKAQGENLPELGLLGNNKTKWAFFDLDGTLITRANGQSNIYHETNPSNWIFLGPVLQLLKVYNDVGYQIFIISNQSNWNQNVKDKINQIAYQFVKRCNFEPIFICAIGKTNKQTVSDNFRKPNIGIIEWIKSLYLLHNSSINNPSNSLQQILKQSFMCGDAIGLANTSDIEYAWSDVDYQFAQNAGLQFVSPKDFFGSNINEPIPEDKKAQLYIMVGNQGSGKSTFAKKLCANSSTNDNLLIKPIESDQLKTIKRMESEAVKIINLNNLNNTNNLNNNNMPIIIDATNGSKEKRKYWIDFAKTHNLTYTIVWVIRDGRPFNALRTDNKVPEIAYRIYSKHFERPDNKEGPIHIVY